MKRKRGQEMSLVNDVSRHMELTGGRAFSGFGPGRGTKPGFYLFLLDKHQENGRWIYTGASNVVADHVVEKLNEGKDILGAYAVNGKHIVKVGGYAEPKCAKNEVLFLDTSSEQSGWEKAPPLRNGRMKPKVVSLCGKLFVMGGFKGNDRSDLWAEFLDLHDMSTWQPLSSMSLKFKEPVQFVAEPYAEDQEDHKSIIVGSNHDRLLYMYNIKTESLEKLVDNHVVEHHDHDLDLDLHDVYDDVYDGGDSHIPFDSAVVVDDMLIWMDGDVLCVYQLHDKLFGRGCVKGIKKKAFRSAFYPSSGMKLVYVGGDLLCLICLQMDVQAAASLSFRHPGSKKISVLHFFYFTIPKFTTTGEEAKPVSQLKSTFQLEISKSSKIVDALFIDDLTSRPSSSGI